MRRFDDYSGTYDHYRMNAFDDCGYAGIDDMSVGPSRRGKTRDEFVGRKQCPSELVCYLRELEYRRQLSRND